MKKHPSHAEPGRTRALRLIVAGAAFIFASCVAAGVADAEAGLLEDALGIGGALLVAVGVNDLWGARRAAAAADGGSAGNDAAGHAGPSGAQNRKPAATGATAADGPAGGANVAELVLRSDNVAAILKDLAAHATSDGAASGADGAGAADELPELLRRAGLSSWAEAPRIRANRLRRNGRFWLTAEGDEPQGEQYERLTSLEAALNLWSDLTRAANGRPANPLGTPARIEAQFRAVARLRPGKAGFEGLLADAPSWGEARGEWAARLALSSAIENLPAPFRVVSAFQVNLGAGLAVIDVEVPAAGQLVLALGEDAGDEALLCARDAYAAGLCAALARAAFEASPGITRAAINCRDHATRAVVLSASARQEDLATLEEVSAKLWDAAFAAGGINEAQVAAVRRAAQDAEVMRFSAGAGADAEGVEPFFALDSEAASPAARTLPVELDNSPATLGLAGTCGAERVRDLGINENAGRVEVWNALLPGLGSTTQEAVSALMAAKAESEDASVAAACDRVARVLVEGGVDAADRQALAAVFVEGDELSQANRAASQVLSGEPDPAELESVLARLEAALAPYEAAGTFEDDARTAHRYFNSFAERVAYNRAFAQDDREVVLVPDEYYAAHSRAAHALGLLGRYD